MQFLFVQFHCNSSVQSDEYSAVLSSFACNMNGFRDIVLILVHWYIDNLHCLRDVVRRKYPEKWRTNICYLPCDKDPAHWSVLVNDFLTKNNVTTLEHLPYLPDLAPADFYPFPWLKSALKGWCFCDSTGSIQNVTEELQRLSQNDFQWCFQQLDSHWQKCIVAQGDYFEGNVHWMLYYFVFPRNKVIQGTFWSYHVYQTCSSYAEWWCYIYLTIC